MAKYIYPIVFIAIVAVFALGITDTHLNADDWGYTYGCQFVKDGFTFANLFAAFADPAHGAIWMPLTYVTFMFDISLFGGGWVVHHAVNVLLHGVNACLLLSMVLMFMRHTKGEALSKLEWMTALGVTLLWALHPMRAEAVTYVASRKEELWTLFAMLGLFAWIKQLGRQIGNWYWAALVCFALSCMSKPTAVCVLPLAFLVQVFWTGHLRPLNWKRYLPLAAIAFATGLLAMFSQSHPTGMQTTDIFHVDLGWRLLNAVVALGLYIWHTLAVNGIHADYLANFGGWPVDGWLGISALCVIALLLTAWIRFARYARTRRAVEFSILWFLIGIAPTLGILGYVNGDQASADRYTYLPAMAFSFMLALAIQQLAVNSHSKLSRFGTGLVIKLSIGALIGVIPVISSYKDDYAMFSRVLERDPEHWRALRNVGNEYCARQGRMDEGVEMLKRSLKNHASQQTADSLAYVLSIRGKPGDFDEVKRLGKAFEANPKLDIHGMMLEALGTVHLKKKDYAKAIRCFEAALSAPARNHAPDNTILNLGLAFARAGNRQAAIRALTAASRSPDKSVRSRATAAISSLAK